MIDQKSLYVQWRAYCQSTKPASADMRHLPQDAYEYVMDIIYHSGYHNSHGICKECLEKELLSYE